MNDGAVPSGGGTEEERHLPAVPRQRTTSRRRLAARDLPGARGTTYAAFFYWSIAVDLAECASKVVERDARGTAATAFPAILVAAASAEAFVNELGDHLAGLDCVGSDATREWVRRGREIKRLEERKADVVEKYREVSRIVPGMPLDPGKEPLKTFGLLFKVRNQFTHPKAQATPPKLFRYFVDQNLTRDRPGQVLALAGWTNQLLTPECARWACRATRGVVLDVVERFRDCPNQLVRVSVGEPLLLQWNRTKTDPRVAK